MRRSRRRRAPPDGCAKSRAPPTNRSSAIRRPPPTPASRRVDAATSWESTMAEYHDELFDDGIDEDALAARVNLALWRKLFAYARRYPRELIGLAGLAAFTAAGEVAFPLITKNVEDAVAAAGRDAVLWPWMLAYSVCTVLIAISIGA